MQIEQIVINASPLIALFRSGQAELLPALFETIYLPQAVRREVSGSLHRDRASRGVAAATWLTPVTLAEISPIVSSCRLDAGESEVLSFALHNPSLRAVVDDRAARRCARRNGISLLGTGGVLVLAKRQGLIASVIPALSALQAAGLWLSDKTMRLLQQQAGESPS
ncbi:MAG: DUF3368 domain-containing protein [Gammaproteobacteria bacterium]|nr:DUF3368 domain-containing protein [Gammaproteobacteria bacterium]